MLNHKGTQPGYYMKLTLNYINVPNYGCIRIYFLTWHF